MSSTTTKTTFNNRSLDIKTIYLMKKYKKYTKRHGLEDWTIVFNDKKRTCASTNHKHKIFRFSKYYIKSKNTDKTSIKDTILHEIAHALVGVRKKHHDKVWVDKALEIGCNGKRCCSHSISEPKDYKWLISCGKGCEWRKHRLNKKRWTGRVCVKHNLPLVSNQQ